LLVIDDSIQRATAEQLQSQAQAAFTLWTTEGRAEKRKLLTLQRLSRFSAAALKTAQDELDKQQALTI